MKRQTKLVTAFILTLLLVMTAPVTAFAATTQSNTLTGDSTVTDVVLHVILPTNLNFALDPLGLKATDQNQITTQDYFFVNQTFAPVKVSLALTATTSGTAALVATSTSIKKDDTSITSKQIFFGALGATSLTGPSITSTDTAITYGGIFGSTTGPAAKYPTVSPSAATLVPFTPNSNGSTGAAVISFALDKADESTTSPGSVDNLATGTDGVAAFEFYAQMNTYADWKANDLKVSGTYTLTALRTSTYDTYAAGFVSGSLNQLPQEAVAAAPTYTTAGFIVSGATISTLATPVTSVSTSAVDILIPFYFNGKTIQSLSVNSVALQTTDSAISGDNLVIKKTDANNTFRKASAGARSMVLKLSDNSTYSFTINQQ